MAKRKLKKKGKKGKKILKKKKVVRTKVQKAKKATSKKKPAKKAKKRAVREGQFIGKVTHYFPQVNAAVVVLKKGNLKIGDQVLIKGHTTHFYEQITSMQIDRAPITEATKGDEIGLQVKERVREHDEVYKIN